MAVSVITMSPRESIARVERLARARLTRDEFAVRTAATVDKRQVRQLRRLGYRLADDETLGVQLNDHNDGATYLTVHLRGGRAARRGFGWLDDPRVD
jgi:hypothetical protein